MYQKHNLTLWSNMVVDPMFESSLLRRQDVVRDKLVIQVLADATEWVPLGQKLAINPEI